MPPAIILPQPPYALSRARFRVRVRIRVRGAKAAKVVVINASAPVTAVIACDICPCRHLRATRVTGYAHGHGPCDVMVTFGVIVEG